MRDGTGGMGGSNGMRTEFWNGGTGQGNYTHLLSIFKQMHFQAGLGGAPGRNGTNICTGGGAGGILVNGSSQVNGGNGTANGNCKGGEGGEGYGAGGGGSVAESDDGGSGACGLVYIEWG